MNGLGFAVATTTRVGGPSDRTLTSGRIGVMIDSIRLRFSPPPRTMADAATENLWQECEAGYKVFAGSIEKPDLDERNYRILRLRNGLKAILVHDPQADKSAACLRVAIGSLCDPVRILVYVPERPKI